MKCKGHSCVGLDFMQPGFGFTAVEVGRKRSLKNKGTRNGQLWIWRQVTGQHHNTTMLTKPWNPVSPGNWGQMPRTGWSSWPCWGLDSALAAGLSTEAWAQGRMPTPWKPGMLEHCWCEHTVAPESRLSHCRKESLLQQGICGSSVEILCPALARQNTTNGLSCQAAHLFSYTQWLSWTNPILFKLRGCAAHSLC